MTATMFETMPAGMTHDAALCRQRDHEFWRRFGGWPDFTGMTVMDFGCGIGTLVDDVVDGGAVRVVGIDIAPSPVEEARVRYGHHVLIGRADFLYGEIAELAPTLPKFDEIISKDTMEHVQSLSATLRHLAVLLHCIQADERVRAAYDRATAVR